MAEAGKRTIPFLIESEIVGSNVTTAVMTAKTGGQPIHWQSRAVKKTATVVLTIRFPGNFILFTFLIVNYNIMSLFQTAFFIKIPIN